MKDRALYSVTEARDLLGGISRNSIYALLRSGELASVVIGCRRFISHQAISELIAKSTTTTSPADRPSSPQETRAELPTSSAGTRGAPPSSERQQRVEQGISAPGIPMKSPRSSAVFALERRAMYASTADDRCLSRRTLFTIRHAQPSWNGPAPSQYCFDGRIARCPRSAARGGCSS